MNTLVDGPRLKVERLDERIVPAAYAVSNLNNSGSGSLREAIQLANANPGADSISFSGAATSGTIVLASEISITGDLSIVGPGSGNLSISGGGAVRIFLISDSGTSVKTISMSGLTLTQALAGNGAAIWNAENLTLSNMIISNSVATTGSGAGIFNGGTLAIANSTITGNSVSGVAQGAGIGMQGGVACSITNCTITGNTSGGINYAGGVGILGFGTVAVTIVNSTISDNTGEGLYLDDVLATVANSTINDNTSTGIETIGSTLITIENCTVSGNGGGGIYSQAPMSIRGCAVVNNTTAFAHPGIWHEGSSSTETMTITNCTISGNRATSSPSGNGGGLYVSAGRVRVANCTITANRVSNVGGGIAISGSSTVSVANSIVSGNNSIVTSNIDGSLSNNKNNLINSPTVILSALASNGGATQSWAPGAGSSAINGVAAPLTTIAAAGALASDLTLTVASNIYFQIGQLYRIGSEIVKVQSFSGTTSVTVLRGQLGTTAAAIAGSAGVDLAFDQRGVPRLAGSAVDIGAVEIQAPTVASLATVIGPTVGGTLVSISGSDFLAITGVMIGGASLSASSYTVNSSSQITAIVPSHASGSVEVEVVNTIGTGSPAGNGDFTFSRPALTQVEVNGGPGLTFGATSVSVAGQASVVRQLKVTFNQAVTVASDAFTIAPRTSHVTLRGGAAPSTLAVTTSVTPLSASEYLITFAGPGVRDGGVIASGVYDLTTDAAKVTAAGETMEASASNAFVAAFGLVSDMNALPLGVLGDGSANAFVDPGSLFAFSDHFGANAATVGSPYDIRFDANLDGAIDPGDLFAFSDAFGIDWLF